MIAPTDTIIPVASSVTTRTTGRAELVAEAVGPELVAVVVGSEEVAKVVGYKLVAEVVGSKGMTEVVLLRFATIINTTKIM